MKTKFTGFFLLLFSFSFAQQNEGQWKSNFDFSNGLVITTFLQIEKESNQFTIKSPKNADIRLFGRTKAKLGRLFNKLPKKGTLLNIKGEVKNDSLIGSAYLPMLGKMNFRGMIKDDLLSGKFIKDTTTYGTLSGFKTKENEIDYNFLYPKIIEITRKNIYSTKLLETKEWKKFDKQVKKLCSNAKDDIEMYLGFNILSQKLPFSHYAFYIIDKEVNKTEEENKQAVFFEEKENNTAYLKIKNFSSSQKELADILPKIADNNYQNLIIDLRNNGGGGIEPAFEFAKYIMDNTIEVGYFVTNKLDYTEFDRELFETLPKLQPQTTEEFIEFLKTEKGAKLIFNKPENKVFSGHLYILTNHRTASTCEPTVYALKNLMNATIIGENTAGAMLSAALFDISGKYKLFLPVADFYTYDGLRLESVGVAPNIEVEQENALDKALEIIKSK